MKLQSPKISVIIPTYNSWSTLKNCLDSIYKQSLKPSEVIVIDNASTDNTTKNIKKKFPNVKLVILSTNTGVTGGRNAGIEKANKKSGYLFFFDHDMVADKNMLKELVSLFNQAKNIGIVTPKIYYFSHKNIIWSAGTNINLNTGQVLFRGGEDNGQFDQIKEVQVAPAALMIKKKVVDEIGGFNNKYYLTYEDTDFCFRALKNGFKTIYLPSAVAFHKISINQSMSNKRLLSRSYWVARNRIIFMKDYGKNFLLFLIFSPVYILYFLLMSIIERDLQSFINFLKGYYMGILEVFATSLPWTYPNLIKKLIPNGATVLDVGCGDGKLMSIINNEGDFKVVGLDINENELTMAKNRVDKNNNPIYQSLIKKDLRKKIELNKKFDVVISSQVVEHLEKNISLNLIKQMEIFAKKRVIIATINGFFQFDTHTPGEYDIHLSSWSKKEFNQMGYSVIGSGLRVIYKPRFLKDILPEFLRPLLFLISYIFTPILSIFTPLSLFLISWKDINAKD